jgi:hypothetical protein
MSCCRKTRNQHHTNTTLPKIGLLTDNSPLLKFANRLMVVSEYFYSTAKFTHHGFCVHDTRGEFHMRSTSLAALVAAGVLAGGFATIASAADLGGNCCADLEERIAELEATTARKGNRKVSLTISGFVAQQVLAWDDGEESNVYITDTGSVSIGTHVKFTGQATIAPGWSAGYVLKLEAIQNDSLLVNADADNGGGINAMGAVAGGGGAVEVESSYWFVKNDQLGRLSVGKQSSAADNQAILPDGSGTLVVANYVMYDVNAFEIKFKGGGGTGITWGALATCATLDGGGGTAADCDGYPNNNVRYDSPVFAGFSLSASWGEDDIWAVSGRYSGEFNGVKLAAAIAYVESKDENGPGGLEQFDSFDTAALQIGAYVEHVPTGLFVYGAYGQDYIDTPGAQGREEGDNYYIKAGLRTRMNALGHTIFYGEYGQNNDKFSNNLFFDGDGDIDDDPITSTKLRQYGLGVVQEVDAAAMSVWLAWRHYEADIDGVEDFGEESPESFSLNTEDLDIIKAGALINF